MSDIDFHPPPLDDQQKLQEIRKAFQISSAQLTALVLMTLGYYTLQMLDEVLQPLFWAFLVSILLRGLREKINSFLEPLGHFDDLDHCGDWVQSLRRLRVVPRFVLVFAQKFVTSLIRFKKPVLMGAVGVVASRVGCYVFEWGCSSVLVWLYVGCVLFLAVVLVFVSCTSGEKYSQLISLILVAGLFFTIFIFVFFFSFQFIHETGTFVLKLKDTFEQIYEDQDFESFVNATGFTPELLDEYYKTGETVFQDFMDDQGYNITELMAYKDTYLADVSSEDVALQVQETLDALTTLDYEKVKEYWGSLQELDTDLPGEIAQYIFSTGFTIITATAEFAAPLLGMVENILDFAVFVGGLFFFLEMDITLIDYLSALLPIPKQERENVSKFIQRNVEQIFVCSFLLCVSHGTATWVYFTFLGLDFAYSAAFIVALMSIFPFLSPWMIFGPALGMLYLQGSEYILHYAIGIYICEWIVENYVDDMIYEIIPDSNPYLTGLSIALGFSTFGMSGILVGPMLVVFLKTIYQIFTSYIE